MLKLLCLTALLAACGSSGQAGPGVGGGGDGGGDAGPRAIDGSEVSSAACFDAWASPVGGLRLSSLANPPGATHLVLFQEPVDGASTGATIELARFRLP